MSPRPTTQPQGPDELRLEIPKALFEQFAQQPRILIKWRPDGLWPIDPGILRNPEFLQKLAGDKEFMDRYEIVVMAK